MSKKLTYKVSNWKDYNRSLINRGNPTVFIPAHLNQGGSFKSRSLDDLYSDSMTIDMLEKHFDAVEIRKASSATISMGLTRLITAQKSQKFLLSLDLMRTTLERLEENQHSS